MRRTEAPLILYINALLGTWERRRRKAMYATVRQYEGVHEPEELGRRVHEGLVPILSEISGFVAYYFVDTGNGSMISISVFENQAGVEESNSRAVEWVQHNVA